VPDDPIGREIAQFRKDVKEDFADLRGNLAGLVSRDVHDAQLGRIADRVSTVERDLDRLVGAIEADRKGTAEKRAADRRVVSGALLAAALGIVMQLLSSTGITP